MAEWHERLNEEFLTGDEHFKQYADVLHAEQFHALQVEQKLSGHLSLIHSLHIFILNTLSQASWQDRSALPAGPNCFPILMFEIGACMRTLRACETLLLNGYAYLGYGILRNLKERIFFLMAIGQRITSHSELQGLSILSGNESSEDLDNLQPKVRKAAMAEEERVMNTVLRKALDLGSHLPPLLQWERGYNKEVHGNKGSGAHLFLRWYRDGGAFPVMPEYDEDLNATYLNRSGDLGWMILRLLPLLQASPGIFEASWDRRWNLLDDSFRVYNSGLKGLGKPELTAIAEGIEFFVDLRFDFHPSRSCYSNCKE